MDAKHLSYSETIDRFLLLKKEGGMPPDKLKLHLNLLKFLAEHFEKKDIDPCKIDDPRKVLSQIKFDGLDIDKQKEYFKLFIEFISFCRPDQAKGPEVLPKRQKADSAHEVTGQEVGKAPGMRDDRKAIPPKYLAYGGIVILIVVAVVLFYTVGGDKKTGGQKESSMQLIVPIDELKEYVPQMKDYLKELMIFTDAWKDTATSGSEWKEEHEMALANLILLSEKIGKIAVPKELKARHADLEILNRRVVVEISQVKTDLRSQAQVAADSKRSGRAFNTVNVVVQEMMDVSNSYKQLLDKVCKFNNAPCSM